MNSAHDIFHEQNKFFEIQRFHEAVGTVETLEKREEIPTDVVCKYDDWLIDLTQIGRVALPERITGDNETDAITGHLLGVVEEAFRRIPLRSENGGAYPGKTVFIDDKNLFFFHCVY